MNLSPRGRALLTQWEGASPTMYRDSAGLPTVGVGHLLTRSELRSGKTEHGQFPWKQRPLTPAEIDSLLSVDVGTAERAVNAAIQVPLNQPQFDALVSFTFNIGTGAFWASTLRRLLNERDYAAVPEQLRRWVHSAGQLDPGLVKRREREVALWLQPEWRTR